MGSNLGVTIMSFSIFLLRFLLNSYKLKINLFSSPRPLFLLITYNISYKPPKRLVDHPRRSHCDTPTFAGCRLSETPFNIRFNFTLEADVIRDLCWFSKRSHPSSIIHSRILNLMHVCLCVHHNPHRERFIIVFREDQSVNFYCLRSSRLRRIYFCSTKLCLLHHLFYRSFFPTVASKNDTLNGECLQNVPSLRFEPDPVDLCPMFFAHRVHHNPS